jgi:hypothetical protein
MGRKVTEGVAGGVVRDVAWFTQKLYSGTRAKTWLEEAGIPERQTTFASYIDVDGPGQFVFVNDNNDSLAYTELIAYNNAGDYNSGWISMGVNSSTYDDPDYDLTNKDEGFLLFKAPAGTTGKGNLTIATGDTGAENKIVFGAGGYADWNNQMEIRPTTYSNKSDPDPNNWVVNTNASIVINISTESTSASTGALVVSGGAGVSGNLNVQGDTIIEGNLQVFGSNTILNTISLNVQDPVVFAGEGNTSNTLDLGFAGVSGVAAGPIVATVNNKALTNNVATLTTVEDPHGFAVGDFVTVAGVDSTFNGTHLITATPSTTTFSYKLVQENITSVAVSPAGSATVSARARYAGLIKDAGDAEWRLFSAIPTRPTNTVDWTSATYDPLRAGRLTLEATTASTSVSTGALVVSGGAGIAGALFVGGELVVTGGFRVQEMIEDMVDVAHNGANPNVITLDFTTGNIFFLTNTPTQDLTVNITNAPTTDGRTFSMNLIVTQGATGRRPTVVNINGSGVTIRHPNATAPTPTSSSGRFDIFTMTVTRRAGAFTLFLSASLNFG